jgi:DNA-binding CsgD family transcriptional regulator
MHTHLTDLDKRINDQIEEVAAVADRIPSVIIIHDIRSMKIVYMSPLGLRLIRTTLEDLKKLGNMGQEYYERYFNLEDASDYAPKIVELMKQDNNDGVVSYFQQVRASPEEPWGWYLSNTKVLLRDEHNQAILIITLASPIDPKHHITAKVSRLLEENSFLKQNYQLFGSLTKREKEILRCLALGKTANEIGAALNISSATAETHRKNVRKKLKIGSAYDLSMYARAFDLI